LESVVQYNIEAVKYIVSIGADIHAEDDYALRYSTLWGHLEVVKYLISLGVDIRVLDDFSLCRVKGYLDYLASLGV